MKKVTFLAIAAAAFSVISCTKEHSAPPPVLDIDERVTITMVKDGVILTPRLNSTGEKIESFIATIPIVTKGDDIFMEKGIAIGDLTISSEEDMGITIEDRDGPVSYGHVTVTIVAENSTDDKGSFFSLRKTGSTLKLNVIYKPGRPGEYKIRVTTIKFSYHADMKTKVLVPLEPAGSFRTDPIPVEI